VTVTTAATIPHYTGEEPIPVMCSIPPERVKILVPIEAAIPRANVYKQIASMIVEVLLLILFPKSGKSVELKAKLNNQPKLAITQLFAFVVMLIKLSLFVKLKIDAPINNRNGGQKTACLMFFKILPPFI
jgi:hypothetical protein